MDREDTYRLVDDDDAVTRDGDHVANDGSTEQRTDKVVSESVEQSRSLAAISKIAEDILVASVIMELIPRTNLSYSPLGD
jgi:hypothetical protein